NEQRGVPGGEWPPATTRNQAPSHPVAGPRALRGPEAFRGVNGTAPPVLPLLAPPLAPADYAPFLSGLRAVGMTDSRAALPSGCRLAMPRTVATFLLRHGTDLRGGRRHGSCMKRLPWHARERPGRRSSRLGTLDGTAHHLPGSS